MSEKEHKKAWFMPRNCPTEEFSILLGEDFELLANYPQGFNSTGDHYFILQEGYQNHYHTVYIVSFNHEKNTLKKRTLHFDVPSSGRLVRFDPASESILFICQHYNENGTFLDLHHFNILDVFESEYHLNDITVSLEKPNITLCYGVNVKLLFDLEYTFRQKGVTTLVLLTRSRENIDEDEDNTGSPPKCVIDVLKIKHTEIWHFQRKEIKLRITPAFLISGQYMESQITKDKVYFNNADFATGDEFHDPILEIDEYDHNGKFLYSYTIEDCEDLRLTFADNLVILNSDIVNHQEDAIRIYKLEKGQVHLIKTLNDNLICQQKTETCYLIKNPVKMFGYYLLPTIAVPQGKFILLNILNGKAVNEVTTQELRFPDFSANWNL